MKWILRVLATALIAILLVLHYSLYTNKSLDPVITVGGMILIFVVLVINKIDFTGLKNTFKFLAITYPTLIISLALRFLYATSITPPERQGCLVIGLIIVGVIIAGTTAGGVVISLLLMWLSSWLAKK